MLVLGVDVGGTKIAAGRVNERAELLATTTLATRAAEGFDVSFAQIVRAAEECLTADVAAIGICAPGPLNPKTGVVLNPPNLPGWRDVPLAELLSRRFGLPCKLENDANAAGLAETLFGAARGHAGVLYVTLSTGIGTGIILDGKIHHGANGAAGEGGHVTIDYRSEAVCNCGTPGCIEALASGSALARRGPAPEELARRIHEGDPRAVRVLDEWSEMLAAWLGGMINLLDPEIIVIGGGLSRIGEPLYTRLRERTPRRTINRSAARTPIVPAALGEHTGVLGAAAVALARTLPG